MKLILSALTGAVFSAMALGIVSYFVNVNDRSVHGSFIFSPGSFWFAGVIAGVVLGFVHGGISGALIVKLDLKFLRALLYCGISNALIVLAFYIVTNGGETVSDGIKYTIYSLIPVGIVSGAIVAI
jgi:hypothetical protein